MSVNEDCLFLVLDYTCRYVGGYERYLTPFTVACLFKKDLIDN